MSTKHSLLSRAAAFAGILALAALPALAQSASPAPGTQTAGEVKTEAPQKHAVKKETSKTAKDTKQTAQTPSAKKTEAPAATESGSK